MNTATLHETTAIAAAIAAVTAAQELRLILLSKLRPFSRNLRKSGGSSIPELVASIARVSLLQNINVILAPDGEHYEVVAGRRPLAALELLVKRRKLAKDFEVAAHRRHCRRLRRDYLGCAAAVEARQRLAAPVSRLPR
jgi:ParB family chromosome partitioning protein